MTQQQVQLRHDGDGFYDDNGLIKWCNGNKKCKAQKERVKIYCLASMKMAGLVHVSRQEKIERKILEVTDSCFKTIWVQKTHNKDAYIW